MSFSSKGTRDRLADALRRSPSPGTEAVHGNDSSSDAYVAVNNITK